MTQQQALDILKTGANVLLTGEPGSGKTHTVNAYIRYLKAARIRVAVTASTGIAATHVGGMTIHSWSGIGIKRDLSPYDVDQIASRQSLARRIAQTRVLIIDEVSMLDGRVLDSVDAVCREVKRNDQAFGGLQVLLVGDFFQLPPVARDGDTAQFAYASKAWTALQPLVCYLSEQHRQDDDAFLDVLRGLRQNEVGAEHRRRLNERAVVPSSNDLTQLFSHNADVDAMNEERLQHLKGPATIFHMKASGRTNLVDQLKRGCLSPEQLAVKKGARVMFTKNSPKQEFVNGTLGTVKEFARGNRCPIVKTDTGDTITTEPMEWAVEDNGRVLARIAQIPLRLAWAITVHKSQGMSLDAALVDLQHAFEAGQGYVALSRVRTFAGLFLTRYNETALEVHPDVVQYDATFRQQSEEAARTFAAMPEEELATLHRNFIRAVGGRVPQQSDTTDSGEQKRSIEQLRETYPNAYRRWADEEDRKLVQQFATEAVSDGDGQRLRPPAKRYHGSPRKVGLG